MGAGKATTVLQEFERMHLRTVNNGTIKRSLASVTSNNLGSITKSPTEAIDLDGDCNPMDTGHTSSVACEKVRHGSVSPKANRSSPDSVLIDIFGPVVEDKRDIDPSKIIGLFDAENHKSCQVIAPHGLVLDESEEESESGSSASSEISIDDDLCAFFDKDNSNDLRASSESGLFAIKTPFSDIGSDDDFGAEDHSASMINFGTPHDAPRNNEDDAASFRVADTSKYLESTLVIDAGNSAARVDTESFKQTTKIDGKISTPLSEKENRNSQDNTCRFREHLAENECVESPIMPPNGADTDLNKETFEYPDHNNTKNPTHVQDPAVTSFHLPTPPPSSDESEEDTSKSGSAQQDDDHQPTQNNLSEIAFQLPTPPPSDNSEDDCSNSESAQKDDDHQTLQTSLSETKKLFEEISSSNAISCFELPTQLSSDESVSSEDNKSEEGCAQSKSISSERRSATTSCSRLEQTPTVEMTNQRNLKDLSLTDQCLVDTPFSRRVHFRATSIDKTNAEELTDTPIKPMLAVNGTNKLAGRQMSLENLIDTPLQCPHPRKSLDSLSDTPLQCLKNTHQHRKRLRPAQRDGIDNKKPAARSVDPVQREERVKKRIQDKYRCRFLDCEAINDNSEGSDEESDIKQIENDEIELSGDHEEESLLHRQFDNQRIRNDQFKT